MNKGRVSTGIFKKKKKKVERREGKRKGGEERGCRINM